MQRSVSLAPQQRSQTNHCCCLLIWSPTNFAALEGAGNNKCNLSNFLPSVNIAVVTKQCGAAIVHDRGKRHEPRIDMASAIIRPYKWSHIGGSQTEKLRTTHHLEIRQFKIVSYPINLVNWFFPFPILRCCRLVSLIELDLYDPVYEILDEQAKIILVSTNNFVTQVADSSHFACLPQDGFDISASSVDKLNADSLWPARFRWTYNPFHTRGELKHKALDWLWAWVKYQLLWSFFVCPFSQNCLKSRYCEQLQEPRHNRSAPFARITDGSKLKHSDVLLLDNFK